MTLVQRAACLAALTPWLGPGQNLVDLEKKVTSFTLPNGMHFIVLERREAPVVSFHLYVNAGAVDDPGAKSGLAHMFEHMIGKGTRTIGTKNWAAEKAALEEVERAYDRLEAERNRSARGASAAVDKAEQELKAAIEKANSWVEPNLYVRVIEENGGAGFNASTAADATTYYYSLPSNRAELWFLLQSEWLSGPVYREFYRERDVVLEERRMRVESSPQGKLQEMLMATAFVAHPYRTLIGWASEISSLRARDAEAFFRRYYVPGNLTVGIAGDISAAQARRLATRYFAPLAPGPLPPPVQTVEPQQEGEKRVTIESPAQPFWVAAYKRPNQNHADDPALDVIASLLSSGRTGALYKDLVRDQKISLAAGAAPALPSAKYPSLFVVYSVPAPGKTVEENERAVGAVLERLKTEPVDEIALKRVKTKLRASVIRQLDSNAGMAELLCFYQVNYGDWRKIITGLEEIEKVSAADVQRVAKAYLVDRTRTVAYTVPPKEASK